MISALRSVQITRLQLGAVALLSALASALIITSALGHSAAQSAALAALKHPPVVVRTGEANGAGSSASSAVPAAAPVSPGGASGGSASSSSTAASSTAPSSPASAAPAATTPTSTRKKLAVGHVFVIALSTPSFDAVWGQSSAAHYLIHTLKPTGAFLGGYETLGSAELPDYLALVSGQAPNADTEGECATYSEFPTGANPAASGQVPGNGCVYPNTITTIADQVTSSGNTWKAYIDDQGPSTCVHPNSGAADDTQLQGAGVQYDTRHNPFIYFHSLLDLGGCASNDVSLTKLPGDLHSLRSTPHYSFIAPGACDDGSAQSCPDGSPAGLAGEDAFLHRWVPKIKHSAAYKHDGAIVIVFALSGGASGGRPSPVGALVISPFAARGKAISTVYNPYSILRGTEDLLGYELLGHAKNAKSFVAATLPGLRRMRPRAMRRI
jgi:hypothetical protein